MEYAVKELVFVIQDMKVKDAINVPACHNQIPQHVIMIKQQDRKYSTFKSPY